MSMMGHTVAEGEDEVGLVSQVEWGGYLLPCLSDEEPGLPGGDRVRLNLRNDIKVVGM